MVILTALFDACVLYPAPLRDLLMRLATTELFQARWSDAIHDEWIRSVLEQRPELKDQLARTRKLMDAHVPNSRVTGYEHLIETLDLPDPDDRHVLAAAIAGGADVLVTKNLKDFPAERLAPFGIEAQHPDTFVSDLVRQHELTVIAVVARHRAALRNPPKSADDYLQTLLVQDMPETVALLRQHRERL
jgi:predicted nucleic acid-binding protein